MDDPQSRIDLLRTRWMSEGLHRESLDPDPFRQFAQWLGQANDAGIFEPTAMSLATVSETSQPWLRTVLLKTFDAEGFVFYTNYGSRKSRHIAGNSQVSLLFPWVSLGRQVVVTGSAKKVPLTESMKYFATRPRGSQLGAWTSSQSSVVSSRALLEEKFDEIKRKFADGEVPLPSFWGGYRVTPGAIEFWQARDNRLHDRFLYSRSEDGDWRVDRLAP